MHYIQARDSEYPPYLLDFQGSPAERHVENIKVSRSGSSACQFLTPVGFEDLAGGWHGQLQ